MAMALQISFRHVDRSAALEARIRALAMRLEHFSANIVRCRVILDAAHQHHEQGNLFNVTIDLALSNGEISIHRGQHQDESAHEDPYVALRDAFRAARRKLQDHEREHRHSVHAP